MPQIPPHIIDNIFYLYKSYQDAEIGMNPVGTGFIVAYPSDGFPPEYIYYGVTNWHVAVRSGGCVIRMNTKNGGTDIIDLDSADWHFIPKSYDIAVVKLDLDGELHDVSAMPLEGFINDPHGFDFKESIGVGKDVFMVWLFVDHAGKGVNIPSTRFGNISMLPDDRAPIEHATKYKGPGFIVDMRSRTGFSGSPVYVYRTFGSNLATFHGEHFDQIELEGNLYLDSRLSDGSGIRPVQAKLENAHGRMRYPTTIKLLGIHWGQFTEQLTLEKRKASQATEGASPNIDDHYVVGMSGMTCVDPAWAIKAVLDIPELKADREEFFARLSAGRRSEKF